MIFQGARFWQGVFVLALLSLGPSLFAHSQSGEVSTPNVPAASSNSPAVLLPAPTPTPRLGLARGHTNDTPTQLNFAPDGQTLITSHAGVVRLWNLTNNIPQRTFGEEWREGYVSSTHLLPDGRTLLVAHENGNLVFWDRLTGQKGRTLHTYPLSPLTKSDVRSRVSELPQPFTAPMFSSDSRTLFTLDGNDYAAWDISTGKGRTVVDSDIALPIIAAQLSSATPLREEQMTYSNSGNYPLSRWRVRGGVFALSPDNQTLATTFSVSRWDWRAGNTETQTIDRVVQFGNVVCLWNIATGRLQRVIYKVSGKVDELLFSPDGKRLAGRVQRPLPDQKMSWETGHAICVWTLPDATLRYTVLGASAPNNAAESGDMTFSPDSRFLVSSDPDTDVAVWNADTGRLAYRWQDAAGGTNRTYRSAVALAFTRDGGTLGSANRYGTITLRHFPTGQITRALVPDIGNNAKVLGFSADGRFLMARQEWKNVLVWDVRNAALVRVLPITLPSSYPVVLSPDGRTLAVVTRHYDSIPSVSEPSSTTETKAEDKPYLEVSFWDIATGQKRTWSIRVEGALNALTFSPDSTKLALGSGDEKYYGWYSVGEDAPKFHNLTQVWNMENGVLLWADEDHDALRGDLAFSPNGQLLAGTRWTPTPHRLNLGGRGTGTPNPRQTYSRGEVRLWDVQTGRVERNIASQDNIGNSVTFLTNTQANELRDPPVLTCVTPAGVEWRLWDALTGTLGLPIKNTGTFIHPDLNSDIANPVILSPDGTRILVTVAQQSPLVRSAFGIPAGLQSIYIEQRSLRETRNSATLPALPGAWGGVFSPDGQLLATNTVDGIALWDWRTGRRLVTFASVTTVPAADLTSIKPLTPLTLPLWAAFTPDGDYNGSPNIKPFLQEKWGDLSLPAGAFAKRRPERVQLAITPNPRDSQH